MVKMKLRIFQLILLKMMIFIINKNSGLTVHPGAGQKDQTLINGILHIEKSKERSDGLVHRLDKDTSGLMVLAKSLKSHEF